MIEYTVKAYDDGSKMWHLGDVLHRADGPAIVYADGGKEWWLNGILVTEQEVMNPVEEMTMEEICKALGKNVKVVK